MMTSGAVADGSNFPIDSELRQRSDQSSHKDEPLIRMCLAKQDIQLVGLSYGSAWRGMRFFGSTTMRMQIRSQGRG